MNKDTRQKRDLHALDENGMVLCNPRDKEAAHRAQTEGIATEPIGFRKIKNSTGRRRTTLHNRYIAKARAKQVQNRYA